MTVLNRKDVSGIPENAVFIGRPSQRGNPLVAGRHGDRTEVIEMYRRHLWSQIRSGETRLEDLARLAGRDLVCFCAPRACHGEVLERAAL